MAGDSGRDRKRPPAPSWAADDRQAGSVLRRLGRIAAGCLTGFVILSLLLTMLYRVAPPPVTPLMLLRSAEGYGIRKNWRPLDDISPALIRAVMASEDQRFCRHSASTGARSRWPGSSTKAGTADCWGPARSRCRPRRTCFCGRTALG